MNNRPLPLLKKGDTRTLLDTTTANEVVALLNKLQNLQVRTAATGTSKIDVSGTVAVLTLTRSDLARVLGTAALLNITVSNQEPAANAGSPGDLWVVV